MWRRWMVLVAALALLLAACGGGASTQGIASLQEGTTAGDDSSTTTTAAVDPEQAVLDFAACMREHGVDMPDPDINSAGGGSGRPRRRPDATDAGSQ
jgi:ABC-type glycerol-3-phosphate transport system substrate-binding protein